MVTGINSVARGGKDTLARYIEQLTGSHVYALAYPIKEMMSALFSWDNRHKDGALKEEVIPVCITYRQVLDFKQQWDNFGISGIYDVKFENEIFNIIHTLNIDDLKCDIIQKTITGNISPRKVFQLFGTEYAREQLGNNIWLDLAPENCILSDIRFENEAQYVRDNGVLVVIENDDVTEIDNITHISESGISKDSNDYIINNNGTLEDLFDEAEKYVKEML